jgi:NADH dehydrogenase FAD-containing subunit
MAQNFNKLGRSGYSERNRNFGEGMKSLSHFATTSKGMLAYIGSDKAIADLPGRIEAGGILTFYFWRSAYLSKYFLLPILY